MISYVPNPDTYQIKIESNNETFEYNYKSIVRSIKLLKNSSNKILPHPLVIYGVWYKVSLEVSYEKFENFLPTNLNPDKIKLRIYSKKIEVKGSEKIFKSWAKGDPNKGKTNFSIDKSEKTINGIASFYYHNTNGITSRNKQKTWNIALKIHNVIIKYILVDLVVYSSRNIMEKNENGKYNFKAYSNIVELTHWYSDDIVAKKNKKTKRKKIIKIGPATPKMRKLDPLHQIVHSQIKRLQDLLDSDESLTTQKIQKENEVFDAKLREYSDHHELEEPVSPSNPPESYEPFIKLEPLSVDPQILFYS